jgi:hypothetical protein
MFGRLNSAKNLGKDVQPAKPLDKSPSDKKLVEKPSSPAQPQKTLDKGPSSRKLTTGTGGKAAAATDASPKIKKDNVKRVSTMEKKSSAQEKKGNKGAAPKIGEEEVKEKSPAPQKSKAADVTKSADLFNDLSNAKVKSEDELLAAAQKLSEISGNKNAVRRMNKNKDAVQTLIQAIREKPRFGRLVEYSIDCMSNLCVDDDTGNDLIECGVIDVLKDVMKINPFNENLQRAVTRCLQNIARTEGLVAKLHEIGGLDLLINSLLKHHEEKTHKESSETLKRCFELIPAVRDAFIEKGHLSLIQKVMSENMDNEKVLSSMTELVTSIAQDAKTIEMIKKSNVLDSVVEGLMSFPEASHIVEFSVKFFNAMVKADIKNLEEIRTKGGIDAAIAAMEMNPDEEKILEAGAEFMNNMSGESEVIHSIKAVGSANFSSAAAVAKIGNLALVVDNVDYIMNNGGVAALVTAVKVARESKGDDENTKKTLESAVRAIGRLCNSPDHVQVVIEQGGLDCVMELAEEYKDQVEIITEVLHDLSYIADNKDHAEILMKKEGMKFAVASLKKFPEATRLVNAIFDYVSANAKHFPSATIEFIEEGGIKEMLVAAENFIDCPEVLLHLFNSMNNVFKSQPASIKLFYNEQGLKPVIEVLSAQVEHVKLSNSVLNVLDTIAADKTVADGVRENEKMSEAIFSAIEKHSEDQEIQGIGADLVSKLASIDETIVLLKQIQDSLKKISSGSSDTLQQEYEKIIKSMNRVADLAQIPEQARILADKGVVGYIIEIFDKISKLEDGETKESLLSATTNATLRFLTENLIEVSKITSDMHRLILDYAVKSPENENLAVKAILLTEELSNDESLSKEMCKSGAIAKIMKISAQFPLNDVILSSAVVSAGRLAVVDPEAITQIIESGGGEVIVMSAFSHMNDADHLLNALTVLNSLASGEKSHESLLKAGSVDVLVKAIKVHSENLEIQTMATEMLVAVADSEDVISDIGDAGVIPLLVKSLDEHKDSSSFQKPALDLMSKLSSKHDFILQMMAVDCSNVIMAVADANPDNGDLQDVAANLLTVFAENLEEVNVIETDFNEVEVEEGMVSIKTAIVNIEKMDEHDMINVVEQLKSLSTSKGAVWKIAQEGGFHTLNDILLHNNGHHDIVIACAEALDEMLCAVGEEVNHMENVEEVVSTVSATVFNLDQLEELSSDRSKMIFKHLYNISKSKENRKLLVKKGIVDPLLKLWSTYQDDPEILSDLVKLLGLYSNEEELWKKFLRDNTIKALIQAMKKYIEVEKFVQYGEYLIGFLSLNEPLKLEICRYEGIEVTGAIMEKWEKSTAVINNCNYTLANCSFNNDDVVAKIMGCSVLHSIIKSMINHSSEADLLECAATVISNLCYGSDGNKELIARLGAARTLVDVILRNYNRPQLLIAAFRAIGNLAFYIGNVHTIISEGAVQGIVAGMTSHVEDLELIQVALGVMTNLAADAKEENQAIMAQEGAVQAICEVTNAHVENADVEIAAISCLVNLLQEEYNAAMVIRQGGVLGVIKAMRYLDHDAELLQTAMRLLNDVSKAEKLSMKIIKTPAAIETICAIMDKYQTDSSIINDGARTLYHLACAKENCDKMAKKGVASTLIKIADARPKDAAYFKEVLRALGALVRSESIANQMAGDTMAMIIRSLQLYYRDNAIAELAMSFVANSCCFDSSSAKIGNTEIIPMILTVIKTKQDQKAIMVRAVKSLENLAYGGDDNKSKLKREGVLVAIEGLKKFWGSDEEMEVACMSAIDALLNRKKRDQTTDVFSNIRARLKDAAKFDGKELPQATKNMLIAGILMTKHSTNALPHAKHVFVSRDLKKLCWRDPKKPNDEAKFLKMSAIKFINKGRCTPQLRRRNALGRFYAKEERAFACLTKERNVSLECGTEQERDEWVDALNALRTVLKNDKSGKNKD